jgi:hypothetical protein
MNILHTFHDGSVLRCMNVKDLLTLPIWKGNRILDKDHVAKLKAAIGSNIQRLDSGYRIVKYNELNTENEWVEQSYIIDGQHRISVLRDFFSTAICPPEFTVVVVERKVGSELEAIQYFNELNTVKPQSWNTDPNLIINQYIAGLEKRFNTRKRQLLRQGVAHRPYLSIDKIRTKLQEIEGLRYSPELVEQFVERVVAHNLILKNQYQIGMALGKSQDEKFVQKADGLEFYLALDPKLKWVRELATN